MKPETTSDLAFESALDQLERIVATLEQGEPDLAAALAQYEQAVRLLGHCHGLIDGAEQTVALLAGVDDQGQPVTTPFNAAATDPRESPKPRARKSSPNSAKPSRSPNNDDPSIPF